MDQRIRSVTDLCQPRGILQTAEEYARWASAFLLHLVHLLIKGQHACTLLWVNIIYFEKIVKQFFPMQHNMNALLIK